MQNSKVTKQAFTHKSASDEHYECLEFLGDSILGLVVSEFLYNEFKGTDVGEIARIKGYLVSKEVLYRIATENDIASHIKLGSALKKKDIEHNKKIISDVIESVIGAVYLSRGYEESRQFIHAIFADDFKDIKSRRDFGDYKSELQILMLSVSGVLPEYRVLRTEGREHNKTFFVEVLDGSKKMLGSGNGRTIKEAEQEAAKQAVENLKSGGKH
ncbi:MAG: ribonuclease III [Spirochaetia bacterium]|nr:ribonuclease III [Spirochaetia bacterium]